MQYPRKYQAKKVMKFRVLKVESANSMMSGSQSWLIYDSSNNVNYVVWCLQKGRSRYCWKNRICYCKKNFKCESLVFLNKSLKHEKCFNIWFQQKLIPQLSMFCLIQGINNYVQINTYWRYIVRICIFINLASNILLLASKKCFLTSQGLVGAGMNCRALVFYIFVFCQGLNFTRKIVHHTSFHIIK